MESYELPNTDSADVMQQAVALNLLHLVWPEITRTMNPDEADDHAIAVYQKIYRALDATHSG